MTRNSFSPISTSCFQFPAKRPAREELIPRDRVIYDSDDITLQQPSRIENQSIQPNETIQLGILRTAWIDIAADRMGRVVTRPLEPP